MKTRTIPFAAAVVMLVAVSMNAFGQSGNAPEGALNGLFSVSPSKQVYISKGNLQYQASTHTWRFAEKQTDYVGLDNKNISPNNTGWIDLFGWGTSGHPHGAVCYQPWSTSADVNDYKANGQITNDLGGKADWGYNAISNGGNTVNQWRTLTGKEWEYLLYNRSTPSRINYVYAKINGIFGVIVLPDDWNVRYCDFTNPNGIGPIRTMTNVLTEEEWTVLVEAHGAAFLPAAGCRKGGNVSDLVKSGKLIEIGGEYWSSSRGNNTHWSTDPNNIVTFSFDDLHNGGSSIASQGGQRFYGRSVRLVRDAQ